jgi:uncharacterized sulfatase
LYEGGIKVPAFVRYPGVTEPGSASDELVLGTDFFVTLATIGGGVIPHDRPIDGVDIGPVLHGDALPPRSVFWALASVSELEYAVRRGPWKMLLNRAGEPRELYNLNEDPFEFFNLLGSERETERQLLRVFNMTRESIETDPLRPPESG